MARKILAIDIQEDSVAAVCVKGGFKNHAVEGYAYVPGSDGLASVLGSLSEEIELSTLECIVSVPASEVSFRNLSVPFADLKKIRQILPYEMEQNLPTSIEHFRYDFITLDGWGAKDKTHIFAALAQKPYVDACLQDLSHFTLHPLHITCGGYAPAHILAQDPLFPAQGLVVECGRNRATLVFVMDHRIQMIRSVMIDPAAPSTSLCTQMYRTRLAFEAVSGLEFKPEVIMATGHGFDDPNMRKEISDRLEVPVQCMDIAASTDARLTGTLSTDWNPLQFNGAMALAMFEMSRAKGINFRDSTFDEKKLFGEHSKRFIQLGVISGLILALAGVEIFFDSYQLKERVRQLDAQITAVFRSTFPEVKRIVDPVHQMRLEIEDAKKRIYFTEENRSSVRAIDLLNEISRLIPESVDVEFTRLVLGPENLLIDGNTDTFNAVDEIKNRLETAKLFKGVTISSANIDRGINRVQFKLRGVF